MDRHTAQRQAIREVFQAARRPLSPPEVLQRTAARLPQVGQATVYRTINRLLEEGWLRPVLQPGGVTCYELAGLDHHHHFRCRRCTQVFDIPGCLLGDPRKRMPQGFKVEDHEVWLFGLCQACAKAAP